MLPWECRASKVGVAMLPSELDDDIIAGSRSSARLAAIGDIEGFDEPERLKLNVTAFLRLYGRAI